MRYGGEYKLPGGKVDGDEELKTAARRELAEEFLIDVPSDSPLHLVSIKQTKPIKGQSALMHNFAALADENPWIASYDVTAANALLQRRREEFERQRQNGSFWSLTPQE